jgi:hypothetical protein
MSCDRSAVMSHLTHSLAAFRRPAGASELIAVLSRMPDLKL